MIKVAIYSTICNKVYAVNRVLIRREFEREIKFLSSTAFGLGQCVGPLYRSFSPLGHKRFESFFLVAIVCSSILPRSVVLSIISRSFDNSLLVEVKVVGQQSGIPGIVRNGVVVPQSNQPLPEGSHVEIRLEPGEMSLGLRMEIEAWDKASDESWKWIEALESDEK